MADELTLAYRGDLQQPVDRAVDTRLELTIVTTGTTGVPQALRKTAELAKGLNARIRILVAQIVPYPLPLEISPSRREFNERRFLAMAQSQAIETRVEIFLCRDLDVLLATVLPRHSTVVVGGRKRCWPTPPQRLARRLRRQGHEVVFASEPLEMETTYA